MASDIILKVGESKSTLANADVVKLIRGPGDTRVTLTLLRKGPPTWSSSSADSRDCASGSGRTRDD